MCYLKNEEVVMGNIRIFLGLLIFGVFFPVSHMGEKGPPVLSKLI